MDQDGKRVCERHLPGFRVPTLSPGSRRKGYFAWALLLAWISDLLRASDTTNPARETSPTGQEFFEKQKTFRRRRQQHERVFELRNIISIVGVISGAKFPGCS